MNPKRPNAPSVTPSLRGLAAVLFLLAAGCTKEGDTFLVDPGAQAGGRGDPPPPGIDTDGDGLTDLEEFDGWDIAVDFEGFGADSLTSLHVTSDLALADTDGDGLGDLVEQRLRLDPRSADTDRDGLTDKDEIEIWTTKPASVDTDGDARGPDGTGTPNPFLFDGNELHLLCDGNDPGGICRHPGTSPTLADTDGDARSDCEEFDDPRLHPLIADLPLLRVDVDSDVDIRLNVEYAESVGVDHQYGTSFSRSASFQENESSYWSVTLTLGTELGPGAAGGKFIGSLAGSGGHNWGSSFTQESQREQSEYQTDSNSMTETAADGTIALSVSAANEGLSTFTLDNLAIAVLSWSPGQEPGTGSFKPMATLRPDVDEVTLAPGEKVSALRVAGEDINADVIKGFLARPSSLIFEPALFDLSTEDGIDFDFLTQTTSRRTALVEVDFGDELVSRRVATNVHRGPGGSLVGVTMREVMELLGFPEGDPAAGYTVKHVDGREVLTSVRGRAELVTEEGARAFWHLATSVDALVGVPLSFGDVVLHPGDALRITYLTDADLDGLHDNEERFFGTDDETSDSDGDGLSDELEVEQGWMAGVDAAGTPVFVGSGYPRRVYSDPRTRDTDLDGLPDDEELCLGTDPTNPDTDADGLRDGPQPGFGRDPHPLNPARRLYVDPRSTSPSPDGSTWLKAFPTLAEAMAEARAGNTDVNDVPGCDSPPSGNPADDVSEIWVAVGDYTAPANGSFELIDKVAIYGGFLGSTGGVFEESEMQRNPDPRTNATRLVGSGASVVIATGIGPGAVLDGFSIAGGKAPVGAGVLLTDANPTLRHLLIEQNLATRDSGGGLAVDNTAPEFSLDRVVQVEECDFVDNRADGAGGGAVVLAGNVTFSGCLFERNSGSRGGGLSTLGAHPFADTLRIEGSDFIDNTSEIGGGLFTSIDTYITNCEFLRNTWLAPCADRPFDVVNNRSMAVGDFVGGVNGNPPEPPYFADDIRSSLGLLLRPPETSGGGAIAFFPASSGKFLAATNTLVAENSFPVSPGISCSGQFPSTLRLTNCTVAYNESCALERRLAFVDGDADGEQLAPDAAHGAVSARGLCRLDMVNCVVVGNLRHFANMVCTQAFVLFSNNYYDISYQGNGSERDYAAQLELPSGAGGIFRNCVVPATPTLLSLGNIDDDPMLVNPSLGNFRLKSTSPCIDAGTNNVDVDPGKPFSQPLPLFDLDGKPRIVDSEPLGEPVVDIGAYEAQP